MVTLRCLQQEPDKGLWAGEIKDIEGAQAQRAELVRRFDVNGIGSFERRLRVPLYQQHELPDAAAVHMLGCAADCNAEPKAYITATHGIYTYPLPLYDEEMLSASYKPAGYIAAGDGIVTVLERRRGRAVPVLIGVLLALLLFAFVGLYLACGGFDGIAQAIKDIFAK